MTDKNLFQSSIFRVLATYAIACFVALQFLDIILEPLGLSVNTVRWVMLLMIAIAPFIVAGVAWFGHRQRFVAEGAPPDVAQKIVFHIGHATLDTAQRQIRFNGTSAEVQPKVFDLIEYLVRSRERVVSKDELFDKIWPSVVVTEASLTQSIKRARDLFRRNGFAQDVIRTVARKGYQFDFPAEVRDAVDTRSPDLWSSVVLPAAAASAVAALLGYAVWNTSADEAPQRSSADTLRSLVVLPFSNMTPDQDFSYFSDGLTDTVTNSLTTLRDLRVIARGSAFSFRDEQPDYSVIGAELNVAHVVVGAVQRDNDQLRISARLIRAADGQQVWSEIYSRPFDDIFAIQDDISRAIVNQMSVLLSTQLSLPDEDADAAENAEAYRLLLLGRQQREQFSSAGWRAAETSFRAALSLRPDYPEALVSLADTIRNRAVTGELPRESTFAESMLLIQQALALNPELGSAYLALGEIQHRHFWNFEDAANSYAQALQRNPGSAEFRSAYSRFLSKSGDFEAAIREASIALDLDPKSTQSATSLAIRQIRADRLEEARLVIDNLAITDPQNANLPWLETNWHIRNASYRDAIEWTALEELDYLRLSLSAIALHFADRKDQARAAIDELIATDSDGAAFQIGEVFAQWGDIDAAFEWLERAYSQGDPGLAELYSSVNLENLYPDPRFRELAGRIGLPPLASP